MKFTWKPIYGWILAALIIVSGGFYLQHLRTANAVANAQAEILKQAVADSTAQALKDKEAAKQADIVAAAAQEASKKAEAKSTLEHKKTEELKKLLASMPVDDSPTSQVQLQVIEQQGQELVAVHAELDVVKTELADVKDSRDKWKVSSGQFEHSLELSQKQVRALEIARDTAQRAGVLREGKGMLEGGAAVFLAHLLKLI